MASLPKYTLSHNAKKDCWELKGAGADRPVATYQTKSAATAGGVLGKAIGKSGGSVRIMKLDGKIQEERTYPRSADPRGSRG